MKITVVKKSDGKVKTLAAGRACPWIVEVPAEESEK